MPACFYYKTIGLNDTVQFQLDGNNLFIVSMSIEFKDLKFLASLERNPKKRRLMQERQYAVHAGSTLLTKMIEGAKPEFELMTYDT